VIEVRSYRRVFDLERRIYSVDRVRLNPGGVPVRGVVYFVALLSGCLLAARLPLIGAATSALPWYLYDVALPALLATVLGAIRIEGRTFHLAAAALLRHAFGARRLAGFRRCSDVGRRWRPTELVMLPDGSDGRLRRLRYTGPGAVLVAVEHERRARVSEQGLTGLGRPGQRPAVTLRPPAPDADPARAPGASRGGQVVSVAAGVRLLVRSKPSRKR
jgi:hypothetical protein